MNTWYTITHEYDGHPEKRWVVRLHGGAFIRSFMYRRNAEIHVTEVLGGRIGVPDELQTNTREKPEPWRYPGEHHFPLVVGHDPLRIQVGFPNEDPDTEDDRSLLFTFTHEGVIIDGFVSDGQPTCTSSETYEELYDRLLWISEEYG